MAVWYCGSTKYTAIAQWAASTAYVIGDIVRQKTTPSVGNERAFRCTTAGTTGASEPTWTLTKGGTTNDGTAVWTEVTGNSTYGWNAAAARVQLFSTWSAAGDTIYLSNNHNETQSTSMTFTMPGTPSSLTRVICVNDSAAPPTTLATTAKITTTGTSSINLPGCGYWYGVTLSAATGTGQANIGMAYLTTATQMMILESCALVIGTTNANSSVDFGTSAYNAKSQRVWFLNTTVQFAAASQSIVPLGTFTWYGGSVVAGVVPTKLLAQNRFTGERLTDVVMRGVDLSALGASNAIMDLSVAAPWSVSLIDCKFGASIAITSGSAVGLSGASVTAINCDSADTVYRYYCQNYCATEQHETTIVRTGGASDGTTTVSRKVVTTANTGIVAPYESQPIEFWNTTLSAQTITIPVLTDNVTLTDADAWIEVEYLGTSGNPLGVVVSGRVSDPIFGTPTNNATDSTSTWTTTGITTPVKQSLVSPSFTAQKAGLLRVTIKVARASTTLYYDPKALSSSGRQYMSEAGFVNEGASSTGSGGYSRGRVVNN